MSDGCTSCGNKGGCDSRKHEMMAAIDSALARIYPTRRWGEWDAAVAMAEGVGDDEVDALAASLRKQLRTTVVRRQGRDDELCDYLYVLCVGREPALAYLLAEDASLPVDASYEDAELASELYLRVALSVVTKFAGVQEVSLGLESLADGTAVVVERARAGVFSPVLLKRFQSVVAVLTAHDIYHLDFGDILVPPEGFEGGVYGESYEGPPVLANYFFFPQPSTTSTVLPVLLPVALSSRLTSSSS